MDKALPTFGVRHLRPDEPFSLLNINERQYETTLGDHPHAALSYVDEDDGEKVTIGSGLELRQRLDDPPSLSAPCVPAYSTLNDKFEDRFIHLFDIQQEDSCREVWRRNQAGSIGEDSRWIKKETRRSDDNDSISYIDLNSEYHDAESEKHSVKGKTPDYQVAERIMMDAIPDLVDNLANLLQSTSETLRKAAAKSRTTQTSPIEDVMSGMSKIVAEVGGFGLSLLESMGGEGCATVQQQPSLNEDAPKYSGPESVSDAAREADVEDHSSTFSVVSSTASKREQMQSRRSSVSQKTPTLNSNACKVCSTLNMSCKQGSDAEQACHTCVTLGQPCSNIPDPIRSSWVVEHDLSSNSISATAHSKSNSILDQDAEDEDADFSRRYPPLMSLRRANTVAGLHNCFSEQRNQSNNDHTLVRHSSWVKRYPHRPAPYVLDVETQRRRGFAQNCFPTQKYSPESNVQKEVPSPTHAAALKVTTPTTEFTSTRDAIKKQIEALTREFPPPRDTGMDLLNKPSSEVQQSSPAVGKFENDVIGVPASAKESPTSSHLANSSTSHSVVNAQAEESSGAFFHRMMRDKLQKDQEQGDAGEERSGNRRLMRPKSMYLERPSNNPFTNLDRSRTINTATNPASRLTRPWEPWYPTITPASQADSPSNSSTTKPASQAQDEVHKGRASSTADRVPSLQRPFSPVWEDHLKPVKGANTMTMGSAEVTKKFDRNGESSSMYSPPPRHMRSVPNLSRSMSMTATATSTAATVNRSISSSTAIGDVTSPKQVLFNVTQNSSFAQNEPKVDESTIDAPPRPSNPFRMILHPTVAPSMPMGMPMHTTSFPLTAPTNGPGPKVLPRKSISRARSQKTLASGTAVQRCLIALKDMGYGVGDSSLRSRLHIYAEAANGDITDAVDMIEEDKRASKR